MKSNLIFVWVCFFLLVNSNLTAQRRMVIKNMNVRPVVNERVNSSTPNNPNSCPVDTIILTTQAQLNNFSTTYPTCTTPKYLFIDGTGSSPAINSLSGLSS